MLSEDRRLQLDGIVKQMIDNKESDHDVQFVVNDFVKKYTTEQHEQQPGLIQSIVQGIAKPFLQEAATVSAIPKIVEAKKRGLPSITQEQATINAGYFGKATPFETPGKALLGGIEAGLTVAPGPEGLKAAGAATEISGNIAKGLGEKAVETVIPLSKSEAGKLQVYRADNPITKRIVEFFTGKSEKPQITAKTTIEKGLFGTESMIGVGALRKSRELWSKKIAPAVAQIKEKINTGDLLSEVETDIGKIADPTTVSSRLKALDAIKSDYKSIPEIDYTKAQQIKSELQKALPAKTWRGEDIAGEYNNIRKLISEKIREKTYQRLKDINIKKDYLDYGNLKNLQELGKTEMTGSKLKGGAGTFFSGLLERAAVPIGTVGGQVIYKSGDIIFQAGKGITKLGDYLSKISF